MNPAIIFSRTANVICINKTPQLHLKLRRMHFLRSVRLIARWVLACFALSLGVAVASPLVHPQATQMVCSGAGIMKLLVVTDDGATELGSHVLDCPLCAPLAAPPPSLRWGVEPPFALSFSLLPLEAARIASLLRGPWQARAPPALS